MKQTIKSLLATLIALTAIASLTFLIPVPLHGQAGVGAQGQRYVDYKNSTVDFGSFKVASGVVSGTGSLTGHVQITLAAADINGMYAAPVLLVSAPGTGKAISVLKVNFTITRTATAFASGGAVIVQYDSTVNGGGTQSLDSTIASTVITGAAGTSHTLRNGAVVSDSTSTTDNKGIYISNATGAFTTGTGTATVDVWYTTN